MPSRVALPDSPRAFSFLQLHGIVTAMSRTIVQTGNPVLRVTAKEIPLEDIGTPSLRKLIADMKTLLVKEKYGVALAAPQVGESIQLFVVSGKALVKRKKSAEKSSQDEAEDTEAE